MSYKIRHISASTEIYDYDYSIIFEEGNVLFYDGADKYVVNIRNAEVKANSKFSMTQNDYVIFFNENLHLELDFEGIIESCHDYDFIDLQSIDQQSIIIHKKYIHKLYMKSKLENMIDCIPTRILELEVFSESSPELLNYLCNDSIANIHTEVKFNYMMFLDLDKMKSLFDIIFIL